METGRRVRGESGRDSRSDASGCKRERGVLVVVALEEVVIELAVVDRDSVVGVRGRWWCGVVLGLRIAL